MTMDDLLREQRERAMSAYGTLATVGWFAGCVYVWTTGRAARDGLWYVPFTVVGMFVGAFVGGAATLLVPLAVLKLSVAFRWPEAPLRIFGALLVLVALLGGAIVAIALHALIF